MHDRVTYAVFSPYLGTCTAKNIFQEQKMSFLIRVVIPKRYLTAGPLGWR